MKRLSISLNHGETALGWLYLCLYVFLVPGALSYLNMLLPRPLSEIRLNLLFFLVNFISVAFIGYRFLGRSFLALLRTPFRVLRVAVIGLILYYCANFLLGLLTTALRPDFVNLNDSSIIHMSRENYTLMSIGTVLLAPPVEEFFFRGLIFGQLDKRSRLLAYLVSTILFSVIHVAGYISSYDWGLLALSVLQYIPAGLCLAWAYCRADNIWASIFMHITINQIGMQTMR